MFCRSLFLCAALSIGTLLGIPAQAGAIHFFRHVSGPDRLLLDSDAGREQTITWQTSNEDGAVNTIRTTVAVRRLGYDPHKTPAFAITLASGDRKVVVDILTIGFRAPLMVRLETWAGGTFLSQKMFAARLGLNEKLDLSIGWTREGVVTVKAGDETQTTAIGVPARNIIFSAAVGTAEFDPLVIGKTVLSTDGSFAYDLH